MVAGYEMMCPFTPLYLFANTPHYYNAWNCIFVDKLWTAPELLRMAVTLPRGTQEGDVYSFAIIVHEISYKAAAFDMDYLTPKGMIFLLFDKVMRLKKIYEGWCTFFNFFPEIISRVQTAENPPFRPRIEQTTGLMHMDDVMRQCWDESPDERPKMMAVKKTLKSQMHGKWVCFLTVKHSSDLYYTYSSVLLINSVFVNIFFQLCRLRPANIMFALRLFCLFKTWVDLERDWLKWRQPK